MIIDGVQSKKDALTIQANNLHGTIEKAIKTYSGLVSTKREASTLRYGKRAVAIAA